MMQPGQGYEFSNTKSSPGDEKAKARWEQFEKVDKARKEYDAALDRRTKAERELSSARTFVSCTAEALERERAKLESITRAEPGDLPAPTQVTI